MRRLLLPLLALAGIVGIGVRESAACSCIQSSPCSVYAGASAVFLADVIGVEQDAREKRVRMQVVRAWKGQVRGEVTVFASPGTSANCSIDAVVGQRRVVYAGESDGRVSTSYCSGGWALGPGAPEPELPPPGARVDGRVVRFQEVWANRDEVFGPIAGARVWVDAPRGSITAHTDVEGRFRLDGVPTGRHALQVDLGPGEEALETVVTIASPEDCASVFVTSRPSGRLSGQVVDANGQPVGGLAVYAIPTTHDWSRYDLTDTGQSGTDPSGKFEFKGLKPGSYVIGANTFSTPLVKTPYLPVYYPGVESRSEAATIHIGQGATAPLDTLVLRRPIVQTRLMAEIVCRDGTRPANASINARLVADHSYFSESSYEQVNGRFVLPVLRGYTYEVKATVMFRQETPEGVATSWRDTPAQTIDSTAPPPLLKFMAPLDKCDTPGGPLARP